MMDTSSRTLTTRQLQVAALVAHGLSDREIALRLGLSCDTIKNHLETTYRTLGIQRRTELVIVALVRGWVDLAAAAADVEARLGTVRAREAGDQ